MSRVRHKILCQNTPMTSPTRISKIPDPILNFFNTLGEDIKFRICPTNAAIIRFPISGIVTDTKIIILTSIDVTLRKSKNPGKTPM